MSLVTRERTQLGRVAVDPDGYQRSIALSSDGAHWAVSDGRTLVVDGNTFERELIAPVFDDTGALWGFSGQKVVRLDGGGAVTWEGAERGNLLAVVGGPIVGWYAGAQIPSGETHRRVSLSHVAEPRGLWADAQHVVLAFWLQHEGTWCWRASVVARADGSERGFALPHFDGFATVHGGRLLWPGGALDLTTGALTEHPVAVLGSRYGEKRPGGVTVSPDGTELWQVHVDASCVRRFSIASGEERPGEAYHPAQITYSLAVSPSGHVAAGNDEGFTLFSPTGEARPFPGEGQGSRAAFSPDGSRLALTATTPTLDVVDVATNATLAHAERDAAYVLAFLDGERLMVAGGADVALVGAADLKDQAVLKAKGTAWRALRDGSVVYVMDSEGRLAVFDEPGPLPASAKPPKVTPRLAIGSTGIFRHNGAVFEVYAGHAVVSIGEELRAIDLETKKVTAKATYPRVTGGGGILAIASGGGAELYRLGEAFPFAKVEGLPETIASTADGRRVVISLHRGIRLWTEEGGRTPAAAPVLTLPGAASVEAPLPGFSGETRGFIVHGLRAVVPAREAEAFARSMRAAHPAWVVVPEGDPREPIEPTITLFVGASVAEAEADATQGKKGDKAKVTLEAFERATELVGREGDAVRALLAPLASSVDAPADWVVATGGLSSTELVIGRDRCRLGWEDADQAAPVPKRGAGTLVAWYD